MPRRRSENQMNVTVAICTWNRSKLFDQTLTEMHKLRIPDGVEWELLVVNNNCTDDTDAVIAKHTARLPLRRLFEPKQGQSHARNCAIEAARGELLVWTDDDVLVEPDWLAALVSAAERWPNMVYFGGTILPWHETPPPAWMEANLKLLEGLLVIRDLGEQERPFAAPERPFGANMAFRLPALRQLRFDPRLGRRCHEAVIGDETAVFLELERQGRPGLWVPLARLRHFIPAARIQRDYLWNYYHGGGRTTIRLEGPAGGPVMWGAPRWLFRRCWSNWFLAHVQRLLGRTAWIRNYIQAASAAGMIAEMRSARQ